MLILKEKNLIDYVDDSHENLLNLKTAKREKILKSGKEEEKNKSKTIIK